MSFLFQVLLLAVAIFLVAEVMPGIRVKDFWTALVVALVYSLIHFLIFWVLALLALPFLILTFGLFVFVINAFLLWLTSQLVSGFQVRGVLTTILAAALIAIVSALLGWIF